MSMAARIGWFLGGFVVVCGGLVLVPALDLAASRLFFVPGQGFVDANWPPFRLMHAAPPYVIGAIIVAALAILAADLLGRPWRGLDRRAGIFLLLAVAIGPGLVVNVLFKDHWGRARPAQIVQFGGHKRFTPAFRPSDQCDTNCSFPAGDPSVGFVLIAPALLVPVPRRRHQAIAGALGLGAIVGVARIAQGGHFLSDVAASGFLVVAITWALHRWLVVGDGLASLIGCVRRPPPALKLYATLGAFTAVFVPASVLWLDRPLAGDFVALPPGLKSAFLVITEFGVSTGYLVAAVVLALGFWLASRRAEGARRDRLRLDGARALFVFVAVAGAGLTGDILKPVFGRARPKLWFADHIFGFTWHGAHAAYWSFPSGHTITIVALAAALTIVARRGWPLYAAAAILVAASRIVLEQHYLSDVAGGAYLALVGCWAAHAAFARAGIRLALSDSP